MSKIFLFYILTVLTRSPLLALLVIVALYFFLDRRFVGLLPDFSALFRTRREIARLKQEVMLNPHNAEALSDLGRYLVQTGKDREGVSFLERALPRMGEISETRFYLGLGYLHLGQMEKAEEHLRAVLQIDPRYGYGEAWLRMGDLKVLEKDLAGALESYQAFVGIHTSSSEGFYKMGEVCQRLDDREKAKEYYSKSMNAMRGSPPHKKRIDRPWFWKARMKLMQGI
ncbi:MAG: tetratricopeptide repeat protein [Deltaproteobacteria bacterium]|nr:tetratricopeptide repeat protein [Deltaproteobacteria bacterium]